MENRSSFGGASNGGGIKIRRASQVKQPETASGLNAVSNDTPNGYFDNEKSSAQSRFPNNRPKFKMNVNQNQTSLQPATSGPKPTMVATLDELEDLC